MADFDTPRTATERTVRAFYEALATGDEALVDESLAPGWEAEPPLRTGAGPAGWKASIAHLRGVFDDLEVTIEEMVVEDGRAAVRTTVRGVHAGALLGVDGTGRTVEFRATDVHHLVDGRIARTWHLEDYFGLAGQIGLQWAPAEPSGAQAG